MQQRQDMDYKYKIYPISQLNSLDWSLFEHSAETCRKSIDGSEFVVRFKTVPPENEEVLSHSEAKALMNTISWNYSEEI